MPRNDNVTFMSPQDFEDLGSRVFGKGWQRTWATVMGSSQTTASHYCNGKMAIPPHHALLMSLMAFSLDLGQPIAAPRPVGRLLDNTLVPLEGG